MRVSWERDSGAECMAGTWGQVQDGTWGADLSHKAVKKHL